MIPRLGRVLAVAGGELLQRRREPLVVVLALCATIAAAMFIPGPRSGYVTVSVAGARPLITTGSAATMCGVLFALFFALPTYFVSGGSFARDARTRLDQLLLASPLRDADLVGGRAVAYVALFCAIIAVAGLVLGPTFALRAEGPFQVRPFYLLFVGFALPAIAFFAALGVAVDAIVRDNTGAKAWLGVGIWLLLASLAIVPGAAAFDVFGFSLVHRSLEPVLASGGQFAVGIVSAPRGAPTFPWNGVTPDAGWAAQRAGVALTSLVLVALGSLGFRRTREDRPRARDVADDSSRMPAVIPLRVAELPVAARWFLADVWLRVGAAPRTAVALAAIALVLGTVDAHVAKLAVLLLPFAFMRSPDLRPDEGTQELLFAMPGVRARYALWKICDVLVLAEVLALPVLLHVAISQGVGAALALACGIALESAWLVAALLLTRGPMFGLTTAALAWYDLVATTPPAFDFAGIASYGVVTIVGTAIATLLVSETARRFS